MSKKINEKDYPNINIFRDVRDQSRLNIALSDIDFVVHALH